LAPGGIGLAAVDVATALGARVIAAASSPAKRAAAVTAGAQATVDYQAEDLKAGYARSPAPAPTW
jgi:NADPH2:quinone reductase